LVRHARDSPDLLIAAHNLIVATTGSQHHTSDQKPAPAHAASTIRPIVVVIDGSAALNHDQPSTIAPQRIAGAVSNRFPPAQSERFDVLVLGSGTGGKLVAWHQARLGRRTAVVERRWIGGSCVNIACMPSKNEISNAMVAHLTRQSARYGAVTTSVSVEMATVLRRKREMVERQIARHLSSYKSSGAELIMGSGHFVAPKTLKVSLNGGGVRVLAPDKVFVNVGTHAAIPSVCIQQHCTAT
jgi:hypothetical protein